MRKKLQFVLMMMVMSIVSLSGWADRVRPTIPATTLESGKTYYLYNVEADLFLACPSNNSIYLGVNETPRPTVLTQLENGAWTMRYTEGNESFCGRSNAYILWNRWGSTDKDTWWTINATTTDNTFTIQTSSLNTSYYNADQYVGWVGDNSDYVYADRPADGNIHWQLIPADETGDKFVAALKLYKALELNDGYFDNLVTYYENLYANRATASAEEMTNAAIALRNVLKMSNGYIAPYWNEYPILWSTPDGSFGNRFYYTWALPNSTKDINGNTISYSSGTYFERYVKNDSSTLSATVKVTELSTFVYSTDGTNNDDTYIKVYVDGKLVRTLRGYQISENPTSKTYARFAEVLQPGKHTIKWVASTTYTNDYRIFRIRNAGVIKSPLITVSLLEPGSLGTEVLYNTDHIKNVRRLKVKGKMNDDDWAKIKMMSGLLDLDLSEAEIKEIPEEQFRVSDSDTTMFFLHRMILPEGLTKICDEAFHSSFIDTLSLPSTLVTLGRNALKYSHIQEINMPDNCTDVYGTSTSNGYPAFRYMFWLKKLKCAKNWTVIPELTFANCDYIEEVTLPDSLKTIGEEAFQWDRFMNITFPDKLESIDEYAFANCKNAKFGAFPESLKYIWRYSFENCYGLTDVVIPKNVSTLREGVFEGCYNIKTAELSVNQYSVANDLFDNCTSLKTLRLNSPTVATVTESSGSYPVDADKIANVDLIVPSFLVNAYKLDKYWYNFKSITGFSTAEIQDWVINNPLVLNHDRFDGTPNITINGDYSRKPSLKFNGTTAQTIKNLTIGGSYNTTTFSGKESSVIRSNNYPGQIYSNDQSNNIEITGDAQVNLWAPSKTWEFFSLPFDCKIADITFGADAVQYVIRYYDGANHATVGATGSWKNYDKTSATIPAGTGFIIQANKDTWCYFKAVDNDMKQNIVSYKEFSKTLAVNDCETAANKGWNLIGNPYQCFYNDHMLNFTAPITVWNNYNKNYVAYSLTDDDYAIRPNEAFFVQCPSAEYNTITFPLQGRQLTDVIESQNAARADVAAQGDRKLINLTVTDGEKTDQTRVVLNENASLSYETSCDASKFMSMDSNVPQLYTIGSDGTKYAINERPLSDGIVKMGFYSAKGGQYTMSLGRCDVDKAILVDYVAGTTIDLSAGEYTFSTDAGTFNDRFELTFEMGGETGVSQMQNAEFKMQNASIYNLAGQRVQNAQKGIYIINGKKVIK